MKCHHKACYQSQGTNIPSMVQIHAFRVNNDCHLMSNKNEKGAKQPWRADWVILIMNLLGDAFLLCKGSRLRIPSGVLSETLALNVSRTKLWVPQRWVVFTLKASQRKLCPGYEALQWITEAGVPGELFSSLASLLSLPSQAPPTHFPMKLCSLDWPVPGQWAQHRESKSGRGSRGPGNTQRAGFFFTAWAPDPREIEWTPFPE